MCKPQKCGHTAFLYVATLHFFRFSLFISSCDSTVFKCSIGLATNNSWLGFRKKKMFWLKNTCFDRHKRGSRSSKVLVKTSGFVTSNVTTFWINIKHWSVQQQGHGFSALASWLCRLKLGDPSQVISWGSRHKQKLAGSKLSQGQKYKSRRLNESGWALFSVLQQTGGDILSFCQQLYASYH